MVYFWIACFRDFNAIKNCNQNTLIYGNKTTIKGLRIFTLPFPAVSFLLESALGSPSPLANFEAVFGEETTSYKIHKHVFLRYWVNHDTWIY